MNNDNLKLGTAMWVRETTSGKGKPNMTATLFHQWVNNDLFPWYHLPPNFLRTITVHTATRWLHKLSFHHKRVLMRTGKRERMLMNSCEEFLKQLKELKETHPPHHPAVMKERSCLHRMPRQRKAGSCISWQEHLQYLWMSNLDVSKQRCCCTNHTAKDGGLWHYGEWFCWCTLWLSVTFWTWLCQSNRFKFSKNC